MPNSLPEIHQELMTVIEDIDTKLDSLVDSETAGKRKVGNDLVEAAKPSFEPIAVQLIEQVTPLEPNAKAGIYLGIIRALRASFDAEVTKLIDEMAATMPKPEPLVSEEEAKELSKKRSELYQKVKSVVDLAAQFGEQELTMPKMRRGSRGKRGPRALTFYDWSINGEEVAEDSNTVKGVALLLGFEKAADFTKALRDGREDPKQDKIDTTNPPEPSFTWTHTDGRIVTAVLAKEDEPDDGTPEGSVTDDVTTPSVEVPSVST